MVSLRDGTKFGVLHCLVTPFIFYYTDNSISSIHRKHTRKLTPNNAYIEEAYKISR